MLATFSHKFFQKLHNGVEGGIQALTECTESLDCLWVVLQFEEDHPVADQLKVLAHISSILGRQFLAGLFCPGI